MLRSYRDPSLSRGPLLVLGRIRERAVRLIERYRIATPGPMLPARQLSGGNLQKVVIAREFSGNPRVVIAASPTQGLDVGATETVRAYLREAAAGGAAVLMFSEDLDEILELADRIDVIYEGAIAGEVPRRRGHRRDRPADGRRRGRRAGRSRGPEARWLTPGREPVGSGSAQSAPRRKLIG